jgi:hypothetical protein
MLPSFIDMLPPVYTPNRAKRAHELTLKSAVRRRQGPTRGHHQHRWLGTANDLVPKALMLGQEALVVAPAGQKVVLPSTMLWPPRPEHSRRAPGTTSVQLESSRSPGAR